MLRVELIWREKQKLKQVDEETKRKKMCEFLIKIRSDFLQLVLPAISYLLFKT